MWGHFVSATCRTEFNLLNFMGHVSGTKRCKDAMTLCVDGYATFPATEFIFEPIRNTDQNSLRSCTGKKKR